MTDIPKHDDFMLPTLKVLISHGGSATNEEIAEALIEMFDLSAEQLEMTYEKSGGLVVPDRMTWARSYLKYPDFIDNPQRGVWVITEKGKVASEWTDDAVRKAVAKGYREKHRQRLANAGDAPPDDESEETAQEWTDTLLQELKAMSPDAFERLSQRLLRESGFVRVEVTGKPGDGGIDGSGVLRMNLISFQVLFQCKRYAGSVSSGTIRDFRGAMQGRADKGLIITTGTFTSDARKEATRDGAPSIDLIDGEALCLLLKDKRLGVSVREVRTDEVTVNPDFFADI